MHKERIPFLDVLRGLAILLVVVSHWYPQQHAINAVQWGEMGVDLFFVLSGFLITRMLLQAKDALDGGAATLGSILKWFFVRRFFRIVPVYAMAVALLWMVDTYLVPKAGMYEVHGKLIWYILPLVNVGMWLEQGWYFIAPHFWSLSAEEQFYLIWPFCILITPRRWLMPGMLLAIAVAIASNYKIGHWTGRYEMVNILTITCVDAFGLGGFLAWWYAKPRHFPIHYCFFVLAICLTPYWMEANTRFAATFLPLRTLVSVTSCALMCIGLAYERPNEMIGKQGGMGQFYRGIGFIGKVSYGMYVFHFPLPYAFRYGAILLGKEAAWQSMDVTAQFWIMLPVLIGLAAISYTYFELPLQRWGKRLVPGYASLA